MSSLREPQVLHFLDSIYAPTASLDDWLERATEALAVIAPGTLGAVGRIVTVKAEPSSPGQNTSLKGNYAIKTDDSRIAKLLEAHQARSAHRVDLVGGKAGLRDMRRLIAQKRADSYAQELVARFQQQGVGNLHHITSHDGRGQLVSVGLLTSTKVRGDIPKLAWSLIGAHLETAFQVHSAMALSHSNLEPSSGEGELSVDTIMSSAANRAAAQRVWEGLVLGKYSAVEFNDLNGRRSIEVVPLSGVRGARRLYREEAHVAALAAEGKGDKAIAEALNMTRPTVARHLHNAMWKINVSTRVMLARAFSLRGVSGASATRRDAPEMIPEPSVGLSLGVASGGRCRLEFELDPAEGFAYGQLASLTAAQRRVANIAIEGFSDREIADRLGYSRHTVANLLRQTYRRWNISGRVELAALMKRGV